MNILYFAVVLLCAAFIYLFLLMRKSRRDTEFILDRLTSLSKQIVLLEKEIASLQKSAEISDHRLTTLETSGIAEIAGEQAKQERMFSDGLRNILNFGSASFADAKGGERK